MQHTITPNKLCYTPIDLSQCRYASIIEAITSKKNHDRLTTKRLEPLRKISKACGMAELRKVAARTTPRMREPYIRTHWLPSVQTTAVSHPADGIARWLLRAHAMTC